MLMFSIFAVTEAPRMGLPASSVTTPTMLASFAAATVGLDETANHNAKPKLATANSATQVGRLYLIIEILLIFPDAMLRSCKWISPHTSNPIEWPQEVTLRVFD